MMYIPIDPKFIIANFENPITLSRIIRIIQYEQSKKQLKKTADQV